MSPFAIKIKQLVNQYKRILKRHFTASTYTSKVKALHIKRMELKNASEADLFHIANRVLVDIETRLASQSVSASEYSGLEEFQRHVKNGLSNYYIEDNKVVHSNQHASRVIVESIQLLGMPLCEKTSAQLKKNIALLQQLGYDEELKKLNTALHKKNAQMNNDFLPIVQFISDIR